ncbi:hypothetical protein ACET3Z_001836 [Daucus carota]
MTLLKSYSKVDESSDEGWFARRRAMRRRVCAISLSCVVLVVVIVSAVVGTHLSKSGKNDGNDGNRDQPQGVASIKAACGLTLYPDSCYRSLAPLLNSSRGGIVQPEVLFKASLQVAIGEITKAAKYFGENGGLKGVFGGNQSEVAAAVENCRELLDLATDHLNLSVLSDKLTSSDAVEDILTWLSAAGTYQETCIDGFANTSLRLNVLQYLKDSNEFTSNSLAIIKQVSNAAKSLNLRRKLLTATDGTDMPHWLSFKDRKLLQSSKSYPIKYDVVVAKDGTGQYKTIGAALKAVPDKSKKRFTIFVKKGVYYENVRVEKAKWNVMMIGDGMDKTVVSGSLNVVDGTPTFSTATFAAFGQGFVARDMGFRNTAGPIKHQAVALMSNSDRSVFYRCRFDAFQDTLYAHANRQFYRECDIYGTVDFIFGNSAVIFQNCSILPRMPMNGQQNTITAQGKIDPNQNTGISIQNCKIYPLGNLGSVRTFLGRPWKNYSTTIVMNTMIESLIDPKGWLPWTGTSAPDTIFYAEYQNYGPGSSTKYRVKWKGLRSITWSQASKFTVDSFIYGSQWIKDAGVAYKPGL